MPLSGRTQHEALRPWRGRTEGHGHGRFEDPQGPKQPCEMPRQPGKEVLQEMRRKHQRMPRRRQDEPDGQQAHQRRRMGWGLRGRGPRTRGREEQMGDRPQSQMMTEGVRLKAPPRNPLRWRKNSAGPTPR